MSEPSGCSYMSWLLQNYSGVLQLEKHVKDVTNSSARLPAWALGFCNRFKFRHFCTAGSRSSLIL